MQNIVVSVVSPVFALIRNEYVCDEVELGESKNVLLTFAVVYWKKEPLAIAQL